MKLQNRAIGWMCILALLTVRLEAQTSLEVFTNQANALLQPAFGFGVESIPVYSATNPAIAYSAGLHYLLQSAANAYDATTPASNPPSVFRPLFARTNNTLFIVGYTNVTTDFYAQIGRGFKALNYPLIGSNDNVWGIPWVVGMKNDPPAFNEYCYSSAVDAERELLFQQFPGPSRGPATNWPPMFTNQFFIMSISNAFAIEAWNFSRAAFTDSVTIVISNQVSVTITNGYDFGLTTNFDISTNWIVNSWPGWQNWQSGASFLAPIYTNVVLLPPSYWSESMHRFMPFSQTSNQFLASDLSQTQWPDQNWTLTITNNLMYALVDNSAGSVLDFVNLGGFGSSLPITQALASWQPPPGADPAVNYWTTNSVPGSQFSSGLLDQIAAGAEENLYFSNALRGLEPIPLGSVFGCPIVVSNEVLQECIWQASNPRVHDILNDLIGVYPNETTSVFANVDSRTPFVNMIATTLGKVDIDFGSGGAQELSFGLSAGTPQLNFVGVNDMPYAIWASADLLDWSQIGIAWQPEPGVFQFSDVASTNYPARYYQVRLP